MEQPRKKVFVSYSYDSPEHEKWVLDLTNSLREKNGIDANIDKFLIQEHTINLPEMMVDGFRDSDFVVIVLTKFYAKKVESKEGGVGFEGLLGLQIIIDNKDKIIFIKRDSATFNEAAPLQYKNYYAIDFSDDKNFNQKYQELVNKIYGKKGIYKAPLGPISLETLASSSTDLSNIIYKSLKDCGLELSNISINNLNSPGLIIWPVVPRKIVNVIHRAQIEIIRVLSLLGWKVKIIISNCGDVASNITNTSKSTILYKDVHFKESLIKQLKNRKIDNYEFVFLSQYFENDYEYRGDILSRFIDISSSITMNELIKFNSKDESYTPEINSEINNRTTLKFIRPLLTWAATVQETELYTKSNGDHKTIVIAGQDERSQWNHVFRVVSPKIAAIFNPILKSEERNGRAYNAYQEEKKPMWFSENELVEDLNNGNTAEWLFKSFTYLPHLPKIPDVLSFCEQTCPKSTNCLDCLFGDVPAAKFEEHINAKAFVESIWDIIGPYD